MKIDTSHHLKSSSYKYKKSDHEILWCSGEIFVKWLAPTYLYHVPAAKSSSRIGAARKLNLKSEVPPHCMPWAGTCSALNWWGAIHGLLHIQM